MATARPLTQKDREEIVAPITEGLQDLIFGAPGLFNDRPGFIASEDDRGPLQSTVRAISQLNCRIWASSDKTNYTSAVNTTNANLCQPYLDRIGEVPQDGEFGPPFEGGQCRKRYLVRWSGTSATSCVGALTQVGGEALLWGPISGVSVGPDTCPPGATRKLGSLRFKAFSVIGGPDAGMPMEADTAQVVITAQIDSVEVVDGSPDNCGDPPPIIRAPTTIVRPTPLPPSITVNIPGFGPTDITVSLDDDGNPTFCVEGLDICVGIDLGGEGGGGGGGAGDGGGIAGGDGLPGDPEAGADPAFAGDPGQGGEDAEFGPPPEGSVWVGCIARFEPVPGVGVIPNSGPRNRAYTQVVGNLSLAYGARRGTAHQVRSEWVEAFRPVTALAVTGAFVNSLPGVNVTIFPVSAIICPENVCGATDG